MIVYVLFDKVAKQFTPTFEQPNDAAAIRALKKDVGIMSSVEDFYIFPLFSKYDLSDIGEIPEDFDWSSAIRCQRSVKPIALSEFLSEAKDEK